MAALYDSRKVSKSYLLPGTLSTALCPLLAVHFVVELSVGVVWRLSFEEVWLDGGSQACTLGFWPKQNERQRSIRVRERKARRMHK